MLVEQLHTLNDKFDFIYMPIDFRNGCNVGYAFINFCSTEARQRFVSNFHGVEVCKCLPGLNSRKVAEVTPASIQGVQNNVQRLRNSPVMSKLIFNPDWMPLIFDELGNSLPFPPPEQPLAAVKPRKSGSKQGATAIETGNHGTSGLRSSKDLASAEPRRTRLSRPRRR